MEDQIYVVLPKKLTIVFSFCFHVSGFLPTAEVLCCRTAFEFTLGIYPDFISKQKTLELSQSGSIGFVMGWNLAKS